MIKHSNNLNDYNTSKREMRNDLTYHNSSMNKMAAVLDLLHK